MHNVVFHIDNPRFITPHKNDGRRSLDELLVIHIAFVMNLSIKDVQGSIIIVSQFTLHASTKKGNRPSYLKASKPDIAIPLYENFVEELKITSALDVQTGEFGADMKVQLLNDGPVTIIIDSKNKE